jgi:hypothetical protein
MGRVPDKTLASSMGSAMAPAGSVRYVRSFSFCFCFSFASVRDGVSGWRRRV